MNYKITEKEYKYYINDIQIHYEVEEQVGWEIRYLSDFIDNLIGWISEATKDKEIMKIDLKYLMDLQDDYILSSKSTNDYIAYSDNPERFNEVAQQLIDESKNTLQ